MLRSLLEESAPIQNQMVVIDYIVYVVLLLVNYEKKRILFDSEVLQKDFLPHNIS